jgi:beta-galactosidase
MPIAASIRPEPRRFDSTVEYQRLYHESYVAQMEARPYLSGSALWNEFDFGAEQRGETIPHLNQKGMYTFDRKPKDIHFFYKAKLSKQNVLHIAVGDQPRRSGSDPMREKVEVYSNLSSIELFLNGKSLGKKSCDDTRKSTWDLKWNSGPNTLTARGSNGKTVIADSATVIYTPITVASNEISINIGSNADFTDAGGRVWIADRPYSKGSWGYIGGKAKRIFSEPPDANVIGTNDDPVFQTMIEGLEEYRLDVPDGAYEVELLFNEKKFDRAGKRVFDVQINGQTVIEGLDLVAAAGRNHAFAKRVTLQVKGGVSIRFVSRVGEPVFSGLRLKRAH